MKKNPSLLIKLLQTCSLRLSGAVPVVLALLSQAAFSPVVAQAQDKVQNPALQVTNLMDSGAGSLRTALAKADSMAGDDTITFSPGLTGTVMLGGTHLVINSNVTIQGPRDLPIFVNANQASRVLLMVSGVVHIRNLTLTGGKIGGGGYISGPNDGGGIRQNGGQLTLENCTLSGNTVTNGFGGGMIRYGGSTILRQCTIANNVATGEPFTPGEGAGLDFEYGTTTISNCTITGNSANGSGGGVYLNPTATATFNNTIIAGNTCGRNGPDVYGAAASEGYNLLGIQTNSNFTGVGDQVGTSSPLDPRFITGPAGLPLLAFNGGPTQTVALGGDSPAVDAGNTPLTSDQRGVLRPAGTADDIGSYEVSDLARNAAPTLVKMIGPAGEFAAVSGNPSTVSPLLNGQSMANTFVTFATTVSDVNGSEDLDGVYFILGGGATELRLAYDAVNNRLSAVGASDTFAPGSPNVLTTSVGALDCAGTDIIQKGNELTVVWRLKITPSLTLKQGVRLLVQDKAGVRSPVFSFGSWTFTSPSNVAPALVKIADPRSHLALVSGTPPTVSPVLNGQSPAGTFVTFSTTVRDDNSSEDLGAIYFLLGGRAGELRLTYDAVNNRLGVVGATGAFAPGSANVLTTPVGALDCRASKITRTGNEITIAWRLKMTGSVGLRLLAQDRSGVRSPVLKFGNWTFTSSTNSSATLSTPSAGSS